MIQQLVEGGTQGGGRAGGSWPINSIAIGKLPLLSRPACAWSGGLEYRFERSHDPLDSAFLYFPSIANPGVALAWPVFYIQSLSYGCGQFPGVRG
jgi:hypothetical protein